jgi:hypothetical protein
LRGGRFAPPPDLAPNDITLALMVDNTRSVGVMISGLIFDRELRSGEATGGLGFLAELLVVATCVVLF